MGGNSGTWSPFGLAQVEAGDVDAIVDQVGALSLDEVAKAGEDLWNELAQQDTVGELYDQVGGMTVD